MDIDEDELLAALLGDMTIEEVKPPAPAPAPPKRFVFNVIYDDKSMTPNVIGRYRFKGYEPPVIEPVNFYHPTMDEQPERNYQKEVFQSMDRIRLRKSDKYDTKVKERKKKIT